MNKPPSPSDCDDGVTTGSCDIMRGRGSSKEALVLLLDAWTPQLSASYRSGVRYSPSDVARYCRLFGQQPAHSLACTLPPSPSPSRKFKIAEHVVSACQHFQKIDKVQGVFRKSTE